MTTKKQHQSNAPMMIAAAAAVAGIGAYIVYGTKAGKPMRKAIKSWSLKAKAEVLEKVEAMEQVTEEAYHNVVEAVVGKYKEVASQKEADALSRELKGYWKLLRSKLSKKGGARRKPAKKGAKRPSPKGKSKMSKKS